MSRSELENDQEVLLRRLQAMGVKARLARGGGCVLASIQLSGVPFRGHQGDLHVDRVVFSHAGRGRVKLLRPRPLFQLGLISIGDCQSRAAIESRFRLAWERHMRGIREAELDLIGLGLAPERAADGSLLEFGLEGEQSGTRCLVAEAHRVILPSSGRLSGVSLPRAADRVLEIDPTISTATELEIAITNRLETLAREASALDETRRRSRLRGDGAMDAATVPSRYSRKPSILLVGPRLVRERGCIESLRLRGYAIATARTAQEAYDVFETRSPELVVSDLQLERSDGIELILGLRRVRGVEEIPVLLVDSQRRPTRREAARRVGAAGYLVYPIDVPRIAIHLDRIVNAPRRRRYTRYSNQRLSVRITGQPGPGLAIALGRGGMFVATRDEMRSSSVHQCEVALPLAQHTIRVDAEVVYKQRMAGSSRSGVGLRFRGFPESDEPLLIDYLRNLEAIPNRI